MPALLMAAIAHCTCLVHSDVNFDLARFLKDQAHRKGLTFLENLEKTH